MEEISQEYIVNAVCTATSEVFGMMLNLEIAAGEPYNEPPAAEPTDGVIALLGMAGQWAGTGLIQSDPPLACKMYTHLLGAECSGPEAINGEVLDAVAEVANMIIGNVKNALEEKLGPMGMSIPTVVFGHNFMTRSGATEPWVVVPFKCGDSKMIIKICLAHTAGPSEIRRGFNIQQRGLAF